MSWTNESKDWIYPPLPRPGGLELGDHRGHDDHQEDRVEEQQGEDWELVEVDVIGVVFYQRAAQEVTDLRRFGFSQSMVRINKE